MDKSWYFRRGKRCSIELSISTSQLGVGIAVASDGLIIAFGIFYAELTFKR